MYIRKVSNNSNLKERVELSGIHKEERLIVKFDRHGILKASGSQGNKE